MAKLLDTMPQYEAIKKAYGEHWNKVQDHVSDKGYIHCNYVFPSELYLPEEYSWRIVNGCTSKYWRINSLKEIETNNGWTKITRKEDMPTHSGLLFRVCNLTSGRVMNSPISIMTLHKWYLTGRITHYQLSPPKPELPFF